MLSTGTIVAIALAIGAFIALKPSSESGQDAFTRSLGKACLEEKERIAALERQTAPRGPASVAAFATSLISLVEEWRLNLARTPAVPSHARDVRVLDSRLREVLIEAGSLARVARQGNPRQIVSRARSVDEATKSADRAMEELGLSNCSAFKIGASSARSP